MGQGYKSYRKKSNEICISRIIRGEKEQLRKVPIDDIFNILEKTGQILTNPEGIYYKIILDRLPSLLGYSARMVEEGLEILQELLCVKNLTKRLNALQDYHSLDYPVQVKGQSIYTVPVGCVCHIAAGNIFLGAVDSLIYGIITKNINIVKVSKKCPDFPYMFLEALRMADKNSMITPTITMMHWDHDCKDMTCFMKEHCDYILLFGGREAVMHYKQQLSEKNNILAFGPKMSFGLISNDLTKPELKEAATGFAMDIIMWEQNACTSCQHIFIEESSHTDYFIEQLDDALEDLGAIYDNPHITMDEKLEIRRLRALETYRAFQEKEMCYVREGLDSHHTLIVQKGKDIQDTPLTRTVYINRVKNYRELLQGNMRNMHYYLGTMGLACGSNKQQIVDDFLPLGIDRFCIPGRMSLGSEEGSLHEGIHIVSHLTKQVSFDGLEDDGLGLSQKAQSEKLSFLLSKINRLIKEAMKSPYYMTLYKDIELPLTSLEDFGKLPIVTKEPFMHHVTQMLTREPHESYIFSPGGSSGFVKYVYYSAEEFSRSKEVFGKGFVDVGITKNDVVANYLKAGSLWTAFIASNKALEATGCQILSLTANQSEEETIDYLKTFKPNVIIGIPGSLILLAQKVEALGEDIHFEKIYYSGNHLSEISQDYLKKIFHCEVIKSFGYAAVETGPIGYQCPHCGPYDYHIFEEWNYVEQAPDGSILVTDLERTLHPIIRYKVGDRIEIISEPCPCGKSGTKIRLLTRNDNIIRLNNTDLCLWDIEHVMETCHMLSPFYQLELLTREDLHIDIAIRMETKQQHETTEQLAATLTGQIKERSKALGEDSQKNMIKTTQVSLLPPGTIQRNTRGKIQKVIDKR